LTETIDVAGADAPIERKVRAVPGGLHVWLDGSDEVTVRIGIGPEPEPEPEPPAKSKAGPKAKEKT